MDELFWHRRAHHPYALPKLVQRMEREILQSPLYWTDKPITMKALALDELTPSDRDVCKALAGLGVVFDTAKLIANEFNAHGLSTYFGICP